MGSIPALTPEEELLDELVDEEVVEDVVLEVELVVELLPVEELDDPLLLDDPLPPHATTTDNKLVTSKAFKAVWLFIVLLVLPMTQPDN